MWYYLIGAACGLGFFFKDDIRRKTAQVVKLYNLLNNIDTDSMSVYFELQNHGMVKYEYNGEPRYILFNIDSENNSIGQKLYVSIKGKVYDITPPMGVSFNASPKQLSVENIIMEVNNISTVYFNDDVVIFPQTDGSVLDL